MQVNNIKVTLLNAYEPGKLVNRILNFSTLIGLILTVYLGKVHSSVHGNDAQLDFSIPIICLGITISLWLLRLFLKHSFYPSKEKRVNDVVSDIIETRRGRPSPNGTRPDIQIDDEIVDQVITSLKISNSITKRNKKAIENLIAIVLVRLKYNRAISRMYQNNLVTTNQGIFTTHSMVNYFSLTKELINLGITPSKVYFEDVSNYFAIVVDNLEDAHFGLLANIAQPEHAYVSTNDILTFINNIKII